MPPQTQGQFAIRSGWSAVKICHWSCCRGASLPLPPTHKSEHLTQHVKDSCFQQPFPPFVSLSKVPRNFTLFEKLRTCTPFLFCLLNSWGTFRRFSQMFYTHTQPTPNGRQVWSWILFAVPTGWSLSFAALCSSLHLSHGLYPTSLWRAGLYHQETHFFKKWRNGPDLYVFFFGGCFGRKRILSSFWGASFFLGMECRKVGQNSDVSICWIYTFLRLLDQFAKLLF